MLLPAPPLYPRKRKPKAKAPRRVTPPVALTLVSAAWTEEPKLVLTFDRAVDIDAVDPAAFEVLSGLMLGFKYVGINATLTDPVTVELGMEGVEDYSEPNTLLTAGAGNGIVAADDGGAWAGVTDLSLPWP